MIKTNTYKKWVKHSAFTLAEVLITIGIIGIVANLTIPTMVKNNQKIIYATQAKKFYTSFEQGMKLMLQKNDCSDLECLDWVNTTAAGWEEKRDKDFRSVFNIVESSYGKPPTFFEKKFKRLSGSTIGWNNLNTSSPRYAFKTVDNFLVWISGNTCADSTGTNVSKYSKRCGWMLIDINGDKKPDQYGRDIFSMYLMSNGSIIPDYGMDYAKFFGGDSWASSAHYWKSNNSCSLTIDHGDGCSARLIEDGWVMNY